MKAILFTVSLFVLMESALGIQAYKECLECFYQNRTNFYYCQSNRQCTSVRSRNCPVA